MCVLCVLCVLCVCVRVCLCDCVCECRCVCCVGVYLVEVAQTLAADRDQMN